MPHLFIDYSDNLAGLPEQQMLTELVATVCEHPSILDELDVKARIAPAKQYVIGTGSGLRGFIHADLRLMAGRTPEVKKELSDRVAEVLRRFTPHPEGMLVQVSVEITDMDRPSYHKGRL
ncbi:5-carboxymethyl-2-hydroxymuconate Delta-isomerase [Comamonas endophytica]|uniref:5-carboxymethyl-2-hydroxymuconate Delta-isomerase n=1 Tax=Comamonas endophytica TaxID=2949090 RepID=A0ABY6G830_9BURK|nr:MULTISPECIES: 5-carboxymethyl-2-hydroxymuconate Delta-isomerase [unclassified Acidovorax]MCD2511353.1 5-carboxymethyl-2-hydroxymuconate Delta-isomerase [Acidovorax sp. D4N7]UYG50747.1 5-carboxymethyl-2-hydroxymuconate Delta-isomerase [Acidovorax sp. 5MLIR]